MTGTLNNWQEYFELFPWLTAIVLSWNFLKKKNCSFSVIQVHEENSFLSVGHEVPSSFALPKDPVDSLTISQCPISVFPLPPGDDLQLHESCHNNFLLK